jgi:hypothetical protein
VESPVNSLRLGFAGLSGFPGEFFGELEGVSGVFVRLLAEFVSGQMISFAVGYGSGVVGVGCQVVQLSD